MRSFTAISLLVILTRFSSATDFQNLTFPLLPLSMNNSIFNTSVAASNDDSIQAWANNARQSEYRQNPVHQNAINTLEALFREKIEPDAAAATITSFYNPWLKQGFAVSPVFQLWGMICEAIQMLGGNIFIDGILVELLNSISRRPDVMDQNGKAIGPSGGYTGVYWRDLPTLAVMLREYAFGTYSIIVLWSGVSWGASQSSCSCSRVSCLHFWRYSLKEIPRALKRGGHCSSKEFIEKILASWISSFSRVGPNDGNRRKRLSIKAVLDWWCLAIQSPCTRLWDKVKIIQRLMSGRHRAWNTRITRWGRLD